jgi:hypothetical protein
LAIQPKEPFMNIAILYIAVGRYDRFWKSFQTSCESHFLCDCTKHYFVFTDSKKLKDSQNITLVPVADEGWPRNTLNRFQYFDRIANQLQTYDYCFFFNANTLFLNPVSKKEVLPGMEHGFLVNLSFHTFSHYQTKDLPYDRNPSSTACMSPEEGNRYYQGGLYGGRTPEFLAQNTEMLRDVRQDDANGIIARNNDESHLNKYLAKRHPLCLSTSYGRPEEWDEPDNPSILFRRKESTLGFYRIFRQKKKPILYLLRQIHAKLKRKY